MDTTMRYIKPGAEPIHALHIVFCVFFFYFKNMHSLKIEIFWEILCMLYTIAVCVCVNGNLKDAK